jgi:prepilin-type N-terminal cleavage/methylation domain-containing protein
MSQRKHPPCSAEEQTDRLRARRGLSLVEVIVAVMVLAVGIIGVVSAGNSVVRQLGSARGDLHLWAALQTVGDSLRQRGFGGVTDGSRSIGSYDFSWSVNSSTANLNIVTVAGSSTGRVVVADTVLIYLGNPNAP